MSTFSAKGSPTWTAGRLEGFVSSNDSEARIEAPPIPSPPVRAPKRTTLSPVPDALARRMSCVAEDSHSQSVDERVALVAGVEDCLAADVRQAEAVAVPADAADDAGEDTGGVRVVDLAEAQLVHHGHGTCTHGDDVATMPPTPVAAPW